MGKEGYNLRPKSSYKAVISTMSTLPDIKNSVNDKMHGASDARTDPDSGTTMHVIHDTDNQTTMLDQSDNN